MAKEWIPFIYREFWDVPRCIVVEWNSETYYVYCPFEEDVDDYSDNYTICLLSEDGKERLQMSWVGLESYGQPVGRVSVSAVEFDLSRRKYLRSEALETLFSGQDRVQ